MAAEAQIFKELHRLLRRYRRRVALLAGLSLVGVAPASHASTSYEVSRGDTLTGIASRFGITVDTLAALNGLYDPDHIRYGQTLEVPATAAPFTPVFESVAVHPASILGAPLQSDLAITEYFGWRYEPLGGSLNWHRGVDFLADTGTPVFAAGMGRITISRYDDLNGHIVKMRHPNGLETSYAHLSRRYVAEGDWVAYAQLVGEVGSSGYSSGPHLHFGVFKGGLVVDPLPYLRDPEW